MRQVIGKINITLFACCFTTYVLSQSVISGRVIDAATNQPIPYADIYLASTSFGAASSGNGRFTFKVNKKGKYELIASFIGYENIKAPILIDRDSSYFFEFKLAAKASELERIVIHADTTFRKRDFNEFKRIFLGESKNAASCTIKNPKDIYVYRDETDNTLIAYADKPIIVENSALGYTVFFDLDKFESAGVYTNFVGTARYEEFPSSDPNHAERFEKERDKSYRGSLRHLLWSIRNDRLLLEGWEVRIEYPGLRLKESEVVEKIKFHKSMRNQDSVIYYKEMQLLPVNEHMHSRPLYGSSLMDKSNDHLLVFRGALIVTYDKESDVRYNARRKIYPAQTSRILFSAKETRLYDNGYYEPQSGVFLEGYLAWRERVSEFLPLDYKPGQE